MAQVSLILPRANLCRLHCNARVGLALKPRFLSKGLANQYERCTPHRDVNQLENVRLWQGQCHDTILSIYLIQLHGIANIQNLPHRDDSNHSITLLITRV